MSGLLQRLAGQALGAKAASAARIRPAASVHAQVPMALPSGNEPSAPSLQPWPEANAMAGNRVEQAIVRQETQRAANSASSHSPMASPPRSTSEPEPHEVTQLRIETPASPRPAFHGPDDRAQKRAIPLPLLDEAAPAPVSPRAIAPLPVQPRSMAQTLRGSNSSEPTEVHVHIGRIEVTAALEPAAAKKARAQTPRQTLPLAEYLARRSRK